ncbi:MAG: tetratricopeptide repeat protein [Phycisphaerae bacterium]|nr:tetratricopeptide repeat protein [Phycisphaerae bacterium]
MKEKRIKCPYCSEQILADVKKCPFCGEWFTEKHKPAVNSSSITTQGSELKQELPAEPEERMKCPYCSEQILADVKKCTFCGEWFTEKHKPAVNSSSITTQDPELKQELPVESELDETVKKSHEDIIGTSGEKSEIRVIQQVYPNGKLKKNMADKSIFSLAPKKWVRFLSICSGVAALAICLYKGLESILLKAIHKKRITSYRLVPELPGTIQPYLDAAPLITEPQNFTYKPKKLVRRNRVLATLITAVLAVFIVGVGVSIFSNRSEQQAKISMAATNLLHNNLVTSVESRLVEGHEVTIRSFLDTVSESIEDNFENEPLTEASVRRTLGEIYWLLSKNKAAEQQFEIALHIYQKKLGEEHIDTLDAMNRLAKVYQGMGRFEKAEELHSHVLKMIPIMLGSKEELSHVPDGNLVIEQLHFFAMSNLARVYIEQGQHDEAEPLLLKMAEGRLKTQDNKHLYTLDSLKNQTELYKAWTTPVHSEQSRKIISNSLEKTFGTESLLIPPGQKTNSK